MDPPRTLWQRRQRAALGATNGAGAVLIAVGWWGASRELSTGAEAVWTNLAVAGLVLACVVDAWWVTAARRAVEARSRSLRRKTAPAQRCRALQPTDQLVIVTTGGRRVHRPDCALAAARPVRVVHRADVPAMDVEPCGMCRP